MNTHHMLIQSKQQNVDLWEAWIDMQTASNGGSAVLYLIGDVFTDDRFAQPFFIKKKQANPEVLALEIKPGITSEDGYITEIMYSEELFRINQYSAIHIYAENELLTKIQDIEKIF
jgi:hypothetical protein